MASRNSLTKSIFEGSDEIRQSLDYDSLLTSSDEYHRIQCSPCNKDGKNVNAEKYCVDCDQHLCQICVQQHNKFDSMKNHQLVEDRFSTGDDKNRGKWLELPSQRCDTHHGRLLDIYCKDHNQVCCGTCVSIHHSCCVGLVYIPNMTKDINVLQEGNEILEKMRKLQSQAESLVEARRVQSQDLKEEKANISEEIKGTCSKIIDHFKTLEKNILQKLDNKVTDVADVLQGQINETGEVLSTLKHEKHLVEEHLSGDNISSQFVQLKLAEKCHLNCSDILKHLKPPRIQSLEFSANHKAKYILDEILTIGDINVNKTIATFSLHGDYDVKTPNDKTVCDITDVIMHDDGTVFMTDFENKCLKRLDCNYRVVESKSLPGKPNSICFVCSSTIAVALTDITTVQLVSIRGSMTPTSSFKVGDHCRGIAHTAGYIYVTCGGNFKRGEDRGRLEIYNYRGQHLKTYDTEMLGPKHILKHKYGHLIYITDSRKGLVVMATDGRILKSLIFRDIDKPVGICSGPGIQYFLSGYNSHTIVLLSGNDNQLNTLRVEGIRRPQAMCFDPTQSRLIVAMDTTNMIKVLDLAFG